MTNPEHVKWLLEGVNIWNRRRQNKPFIPDLNDVDIYTLFKNKDMLSDSGLIPLQGINLSGAGLNRSTLNFANLSNANLSNISAMQAKFDNSIFDNVDACNAAMLNSSITRTNILSANFSEADTRRIDFKYSNLSGSNFSNISSTGADFEHTILRDVDFNGADLERADLSFTDLEKTSFIQANMVNAELFCTETKQTNFKEANLTGAYITSNLRKRSEDKYDPTDLSEALNLTQKQVDSMNGDTSTILPTGLKAPDHWPIVTERDLIAAVNLHKLSQKTPIAYQFFLNKHNKLDAEPIKIDNQKFYETALNTVRDSVSDVEENSTGNDCPVHELNILKRTLNNYANDPLRIYDDFIAVRNNMRYSLKEGYIAKSNANLNLVSALDNAAIDIRNSNYEVAEVIIARGKIKIKNLKSDEVERLSHLLKQVLDFCAPYLKEKLENVATPTIRALDKTQNHAELGGLSIEDRILPTYETAGIISGIGKVLEKAKNEIFDRPLVSSAAFSTLLLAINELIGIFSILFGI